MSTGQGHRLARFPVVNEQTVRVPPYYVFGQNQLQFYYDLRPVKIGECQDVLPNNVQEVPIDPGSMAIDLSKTERFTSLPNLAFFVNSGFPYTKMADLSDTAIVLPESAHRPGYPGLPRADGNDGRLDG